MPLGSLTLALGLYAILMAFLNDQFGLIAAAVGAGILLEIPLVLVKPAPDRKGAFHLFGFALPAVYLAVCISN